MVLYVNSCIREESRTDKLARALLDKLVKYFVVALEELEI